MISMVITDKQVQAVLAGIAQIEAALPGLISLEPGERKGLAYMGQKSEVFGRGTIRALAQNPQIVPPSLDLAGAQADLAAFDQLRPIAEALQRLHSRVDDTLAALGSDVMDVAYEGYGQLKRSGAAHGLVDLRRDLGTRFSRTRRKEAAVAVA
jgi:hypothetical protein